MRNDRPWMLIGKLALVTALYVVGGKLGLSLAFVHPSATAVWPPTAIALAAFLMLGRSAAPAVFAGAFLVNVTTAGTVLTSLGIAVGNTLEGWLGALLVRRFAGGRELFTRSGDVFRFALAIAVAAVTSATIGVGTLTLADLAPATEFARIWTTWWLGDVAGALVVFPAIALIRRGDGVAWSPAASLEAVALLAALLLAGGVVFGDLLAPGRGLPLDFLCVPPLAWAAFRFGRREAALAIVLLSVLACWGTVRGLGPFVRPGTGESLLILQSFMSVLALTTLAIASTVWQRRRAEEGVHRLNAELEARVEQATGRLRAANEELRAEVEQRRRADESLTRSEAAMREAQRVAHIGSWEWSLDEDSVWWSDELHRIYDHDPARPIAYRDFLEAIHPDDRDRVDAVVRRAAEDGRGYSFEHRIVRPGGEVRTVYSEGQAVRDERGRIVRLLGICQDVTERKHAEDQRARLEAERRAREQAEEAIRVKDEFLAVLSHELRTPLSAITGWCHLLRDGQLDEAGRARAVEIIDRNAKLQARLIADILEISRLDSGKVQIELRPLALLPVVRAALDTIGPQAREKRVRLDVDLGAAPVFVDGDSDRLQQVIWNLLANAVKFSPEGGAVRVRLAAGEGSADLEVVDEGPGIDPAFLPHLFEAFRQDESRTTRRHGGLGLGLSIARRIVELHGGSVRAENRAGAGAAFTVRLPLRPPPAAHRADEAPRRAAADRRLAGVRILVVDDELDARDVLAAALGLQGAAVRACGSAAEGMAALRGGASDVLISDIGMPGEDGFEFLRRVRAEPGAAFARIPAIALTAYSGAEDVRRAHEAGFHLHLAKPIDVDALVDAVERLVARADSAAGEAVEPSGH